MAEQTAGKEATKPDAAKPKKERKPIPYIVFVADGDKDADPAKLDWRIVGVAEGIRPKDAKAAVLNQPQNAELKAQVEQDGLWIESVSQRNWSPSYVGMEQPPPVLKGL